jgi:hypothetical protein
MNRRHEPPRYRGYIQDGKGLWHWERSFYPATGYTAVCGKWMPQVHVMDQDAAQITGRFCPKCAAALMAQAEAAARLAGLDQRKLEFREAAA